jgi:hypothetical protein
MTTSFTTTEEFPSQQEEEFGTQYPIAFGIELTPKVSGILFGVVGFLIAGYIVYSQIFPLLAELGQLQAKKQENESLLNSLQNQKGENKLQQKQAELEETKDVKEEVMALFANERQLETLLIDLNKSVNFTNVLLKSYNPSGDFQVVTDDSFGELAKEKIKSKSINLEVEGTFSQIQFLLQDIERLQPLLVVKNFNANILEPQKYLWENGKIVSLGEPKLNTSISLNAVIPVPQEELPQAIPEEENDQK